MAKLGRAALVVLLAGCGGSVNGDPAAQGVGDGRGGSRNDAAGGTGGRGERPVAGAPGSGGTESGGRSSAGGTEPGTGGSGSGGFLTTGGAFASGGTESSGGAFASGGTESSGGVPATDGSPGDEDIWPDYGSIENCKPLSTVPGGFSACGAVRGLEITPDGKRLIGVFDGPSPNVHVWTVADGELVKSLPGPARGALCSALSRDGKRLGVCARHRSLEEPGAHVYDLETYEEVFAIRGVDAPSEMSFSGDGTLLATGQQGRVWRVADGSLHAEYPGTELYKMQFSPTDSSRILTLDQDGYLFLDPATAKESALTQTEETDYLSLSPNGQHLVGVTWNGKVQLRDPTNGAILVETSIPSGGEGDNRIRWLTPERFAIVEESLDITFFDVKNGSRLVHVSTATGIYLRAAAGTPDGHFVAVGVVRANGDDMKHGITFITP